MLEGSETDRVLSCAHAPAFPSVRARRMLMPVQRKACKLGCERVSALASSWRNKRRLTLTHPQQLLLLQMPRTHWLSTYSMRTVALWRTPPRC